MRTFTDAVAAITGAGSGIGKELANGFAARGTHLAIADIHEDNVQTVARELAQDYPNLRISTHVVDVADKEAVWHWADEVKRIHGGVNYLMNNAGVTVVRAFDDHSVEDFEWVLSVNLFGVIYGCKAFMPMLQAADFGHIVNLSSLFGIIGVPGQTAYCASKYAVRGFSEALKEELYDSHIGLTVVHPGGIRTNIIENARGKEEQPEVRKFFQNKLMKPSTAARQILEAVENNQFRLVITREAVLADYIKRLAPVKAMPTSSSSSWGRWDSAKPGSYRSVGETCTHQRKNRRAVVFASAKG